jgi:hypothetical protein
MDQLPTKNLENNEGQILLNRHDRNYPRENYWANVFHDSIRGYKELQNLSLNIGRFAGSYSMFYLLSRILKDYMPQNVLELGIGETTKFISTFMHNYYPQKQKLHQHFAVEHHVD